VGWRFISLYTVAYMSTSLLFLAPLLVTLALKVDSLVGLSRAPASLALVAGTGALVAMVGNPFFGQMSDGTASKLGMRRPWMIIGLAGGSAGILIVALAPSVPLVLAGWCIAELFFNALLAAMAAVLPDQVPSVQRGQVSGVLGVCAPDLHKATIGPASAPRQCCLSGRGQAAIQRTSSRLPDHLDV
jgi:MFS family permease